MIDACDLHAKLYQLGHAIRESDLIFSEYKSLIDLLQVVHDLVNGLDVADAGAKVLKRYSNEIPNNDR